MAGSETPTESPRGTGRAGSDDREVRSSAEASNDRGAKGRPQFKGNAGSSQNREIGVSLTTPAKVRELQRALYAKAKANPAYRFYALHDKIYRKDVLLGLEVLPSKQRECRSRRAKL